MNRKTNIAAGIEKNRIALMRIVYGWLVLAHLFGARGDKPLRRRLALYVASLIGKAEMALGLLLIAAFYNGQTTKRHCPAFDREVNRLVASNAAITLQTLTITGVVKRLQALQHKLQNIHKIAKLLAKNVSAHVRVRVMKIAALSAVSVSSDIADFGRTPRAAIKLATVPP